MLQDLFHRDVGAVHMASRPERRQHHSTLARLSLVATAGALAFSVLACAPPDYAADVQALEAAFPTFDELGLEFYSGSCGAIIYQRGAFAADPDCSADIRDAGVAIQPVDDQARQDMARVARSTAPYKELESAVIERNPVTGAIGYGDFTLQPTSDMEAIPLYTYRRGKGKTLRE